MIMVSLLSTILTIQPVVCKLKFHLNNWGKGGGVSPALHLCVVTACITVTSLNCIIVIGIGYIGYKPPPHAGALICSY